MFYVLTTMFHIPGRKTQVRLFDRVETVDDQYDIYDVGFQYADGGIDSLAFGGSFYSLKRAIEKANAGVTSRDSDSTPGAVVDASGAPVDVAGL